MIVTYHILRTDLKDDQYIGTYATYSEAVDALNSILEDCVVEMPQLVGNLKVVTDTGIIVG